MGLVGNRLKGLVQTASALGFHLMSLDLRQNADVHERVVAELFASADAKEGLNAYVAKRKPQFRGR